MSYREILFEMADLDPKETGLPFDVFASPRGSARHAARIKVTMAPVGAHPEAIYALRPFRFIEGDHWLSSQEEAILKGWVELNLQALVDFWNSKIIRDSDLRNALISVGDAPPTNHAQAIGALRASAPKVQNIRWFDNGYHLVFDGFAPDPKKTIARFQRLGFTQQLILHSEPFDQGILLWER